MQGYRVPTVAVVLLAASLVWGGSTGASASPAFPGSGCVVAGGKYRTSSDQTYSLPNVDVFEGSTLPWLPEGVEGNTLTLVNSVLYSCGGNTQDGEPTAVCHSLDTSQSNPEWKLDISLPKPMAHHTAVTVGGQIWFVFDQMIYAYDIPTSKFLTYSTSFVVTSEHCAASNGTHAFVVGAGADRNEIWVNSNDYVADRWEKAFDMPTVCWSCGCLIYIDMVIASGGYPNQEKTVGFNFVYDSIHTLDDLVQPRSEHSMFMLDGMVAVVGGYDNQGSGYLDSVETLNSSTARWSFDDRTLAQARSFMGLAQL